MAAKSMTSPRSVDVRGHQILLARVVRRHGIARETPTPEARPHDALARASIPRVTAAPAGPPYGGLYLKPPSSGGLCEGVTTMPSASARGADGSS